MIMMMMIVQILFHFNTVNLVFDGHLWDKGKMTAQENSPLMLLSGLSIFFKCTSTSPFIT